MESPRRAVTPYLLARGEDRVGRLEDLRQRIPLNADRISSEKSCGSSQAAKCPPLSTALKYRRVGYAFSTQLRGAAKISPGKLVKATGTESSGKVCPAAAATA